MDWQGNVTFAAGKKWSRPLACTPAGGFHGPHADLAPFIKDWPWVSVSAGQRPTPLQTDELGRQGLENGVLLDAAEQAGSICCSLAARMSRIGRTLRAATWLSSFSPQIASRPWGE